MSKVDAVGRRVRRNPRYSGVNFTQLNLGFGLGGMLGGAFVDVDRLGTFEAIYLLDAPATSRLCSFSWSRCTTSPVGPAPPGPRRARRWLPLGTVPSGRPGVVWRWPSCCSASAGRCATPS